MTISYNGIDRWILSRYDSPNTFILAENVSDEKAPPQGNWTDIAKDGTVVPVFRPSELGTFPVNSIINGNITATSAVVVSHDSPHRLIVNNLEQSYSDGEILSSESTNITRRVFNTELK